MTTRTESGTGVGYRLFDADSHYYETRDAFTRYIEPKYRHAAIHPILDASGEELVLGGGRVINFGDTTNFAKVAVPGSLKEKLRLLKAGAELESAIYQPVQPEFIRRDARLAVLDAQNVQGCLMFGDLGMYAESYVRRTDELYANLDGYNRWLAEEWGFAFQGRVFAVPVISMRDLERAVRQVEWAIAQGARAIMLRTGPQYGRSPGDPWFDPIWARLNEAEVRVTYHITECGYNENVSVLWGEDPAPRAYEQSAWQWMNCYGDRAIMDTLSALIYDNLFGRFPRLQVMAVEHGAEWLPYFLTRLDKMRGMARNGPWRGGPLPARPSQIFREHVKVVPYPEDDIQAIAAKVGSECLVMGSDFPHGEGMAEPASMPELVRFLPEPEIRAVCRDRGLAFVRVH
jgi:predicted TIM-barrel fold metal-dependent hydrolase